MQFSQEQLEEFKKVYKEDYGREISDDEAVEMYGRLVRLVKMLVDLRADE